MWERLRDAARKWLGADAAAPGVPADGHARRYERGEDMVTATIAGKLAALTGADSTFSVVDAAGGDALTPRAALIRDALEPFWRRNGEWITAQALGKGGMLLVPTVGAGGAIEIQVADQSRLVALEQRGGRLTRAAIVADEYEQGGRRFMLLASYALSDGAQRISCRAFDDAGRPVPLGAVPAWKDITPAIDIADTDRLLYAYLKCPRDNRATEKLTGVPITHGAEKLIDELNEHARIYRREFKLTRPMLGLDSALWKDLPASGDIRALRRTVQDSDDPFVPFPTSAMSVGAPWQYFAPDIRADAMETRLDSLCRRVEKACGLSQGILTERPALRYSNRDEVRAAQYDTFATVRAIRGAWEEALADLAYAVDVLAERFALTECGGCGQYALKFDWDLSMIESTAETFSQLAELQSRGGCTLEELRAWVMGEARGKGGT